MLPSENDSNSWIIGNPDNRRVVDYQSAAVAIGIAPPRCLPWQSLLDEPDESLAKLAGATSVRIDSPGENESVSQRLIMRGVEDGLAPKALAFGEIGHQDAYYRGLCSALGDLSQVNVVFQNSPADIAVMFDKWATHRRFVDAGIARPKTTLAPKRPCEWHAFRQQFCGANHGRMFLKPRFGSSASGVCAYRWAGDREQLIAPIEIHGTGGQTRLFNSLCIQRYSSPQDIQTILDRLLPQQMIAERWIRKLQMPGGNVDLRIVVIAGEARQIVVRQSQQPMTNLHLGNRRGDWQRLRSQVGDDILDQCRDLAVSAAACFDESLYAGVDVILSDRREPTICEINAFGDLLPGLQHRGEGTYEAILKAAHAACRSV